MYRGRAPRRRARCALAGAALSALAATAVLAQDRAPLGPLICYPNAPGSPEAARPYMQRLGDYLAARCGPGWAPEYFNVEAAARARLEGARPRYALLSLDVFLAWRDQVPMTAVVATERNGRSAERYHLLVRADAPYQGLDDLKQQARQPVIWSSHLDDPRFGTHVVFQGALRLDRAGNGEARVASTQHPLKALRRLVRGAAFEGQPVDAVLVDDSTLAALEQLESFRGAYRVLHASPPLPTPLVVALGEVPAAERDRLAAALLGMRDDPAGRDLLEALMLTGFAPADAAALAAAREVYDRGFP